MPPADDPDADGHGDDRDLDVAEYGLGVLLPEQGRAFEALVLADSAVAASLRAWETRLAPLTGAVPPVFPPRVLWCRLALATGIEPAPNRRSEVFSPAKRL